MAVQGWGVQGYISLEPQLDGGLQGFSVPEPCFKSHSLVWLCESDIYLRGMRSSAAIARGRRPWKIPAID